MKLTRLNPFIEKILKLEARGMGVDQVMIVIPSVIRTGVNFDARVSLLDKNRMPVFDGTDALTVTGEGIEFVVPPFEADEAATCQVSDIRINTPGFIRLQAEYKGKQHYSNPAMVTTEDRPGICWGDPHIHTSIGDCHPQRCRTRNLAYAAAHYVYALDFIAVADHISWSPRGTKGKWLDNLASCKLFDEPDVFSTLYCYEASLRGGHGGDNNVYLREPQEDYVDPWPDEMHAGQLCDAIRGDFFVVPHHTTRTGKHGEISAEIYPGPEKMPVVEIHSKWGCSEYRGNPNPLHSIHPGPSYVQDLLAQGYRLGFIGGTDSHTSLTFNQTLESEIHDRLPGLTAVMVQKNRREEIYDAIKAKNCYAACGERIYLDVRMDANRCITIRCAAQSNIDRVDIVCNGQDVFTTRPEDWQAELSWTDERQQDAIALKAPGLDTPFIYYYVRVTTETEAQAWSSPIWVQP